MMIIIMIIIIKMIISRVLFANNDNNKDASCKPNFLKNIVVTGSP